MTLTLLLEQVERRCDAIRSAHGNWPCRKGCDACCRRLAAVPLLSPPEVELLREGVSTLPPEVRAGIAARISGLGAAPIVCPFLDEDAAACLIYECRPVACRTYGYYVDREAGLYCSAIRDAVDRGDFAGVLWGNQEAVDRRLDGYGERLELAVILDAGNAGLRVDSYAGSIHNQRDFTGTGS